MGGVVRNERMTEERRRVRFVSSCLNCDVEKKKKVLLRLIGYIPAVLSYSVVGYFIIFFTLHSYSPGYCNEMQRDETHICGVCKMYMSRGGAEGG